MRNKLLFTALFICGINSYASQSNSINEKIENKILGVWEFDIPSVNCHETRDFRVGGIQYASASNQFLKLKYSVEPIPTAAGFYKFKESILTDNGGYDCFDRPMPDKSDYTFYLKFSSSGNEFAVCLEESLDTCAALYVKKQNKKQPE